MPRIDSMLADEDEVGYSDDTGLEPRGAGDSMAVKTKARRKTRVPQRKPAPPSPVGGELKTGSLAPHPAASRSIAESIGAQVRSLRRKLDLTGAELADQAGLSAGMLSKIENGAVSASIDSLEALSRALNVPLTTFFATYEEQRDCSYVMAGKGVTIERRGTKAGHQYQLLGHSISGEIVVEPYLITLTEEAKPYTLFQHAGVEFIFMLTGRVLYRHADKAYPLAPGDALFFDAAALHGPEELTKLPMTYLSIIIYPRT